MLVSKKGVNMELKFDVMFRPKVLGIGIDIGSNTTYYGKWGNLFIEIIVLFWAFSVELDRLDYIKRKRNE
jgi:hypothetical protein